MVTPSASTVETARLAEDSSKDPAAAESPAAAMSVRGVDTTGAAPGQVGALEPRPALFRSSAVGSPGLGRSEAAPGSTKYSAQDG